MEKTDACETDPRGRADGVGPGSRAGRCLGGFRSAVDTTRRHRSQRHAGREGALAALPRMAARMRGALGLAHAYVLPLPGPARLLKRAADGSVSSTRACARCRGMRG